MSQTLPSYFQLFLKAPHLVAAVEKCILYLQYDREFSYCLNKWASIAANSIPSNILHISPTGLRKLHHSCVTTYRCNINKKSQIKYSKSINNMSLDGYQKSDGMMLVNFFGNYSVTVYINCSHISSSKFTKTPQPIGSETWLVSKERTYMGKWHEFTRLCLDNGLPKKKNTKKMKALITDDRKRPPSRWRKHPSRGNVTKRWWMLIVKFRLVAMVDFTNWIRHQTNTERQNHLPHSHSHSLRLNNLQSWNFGATVVRVENI